MTLLYKQLNLVTVLTTVILLGACTEKAADSNQAKTVAPPVATVTEDRFAQW